MKGDLEPPRPVAPGLQPGAEFGGDVLRHPGHVFRRADRLDQGQSRQPGCRWTAEPQGLGTAAQRLIQPLQRRGPEPPGQRRAGQGDDLLQPAQTQATDLGGGLRRQAQGLRRQGLQELGLFAGRGDGLVEAEVGQRPGGTRRIGDAHAKGQAARQQALTEVRHHAGLIAPEMGDARDIQEQAARRVCRHPLVREARPLRAHHRRLRPGCPPLSR